MTYDTIDNDVTMPGATGAPLGRSDAAGNVFDAKSVSDAVTMAPGGGLSLGRIDQYELVRELGGGGFGSVYLAKDTVAGIEVAVKGLPPMIRNNAEELERIRENFALVSRLHHPYIAAALHLQLAKEVSYASEDVRQKLRVLSGDTLMVMEYAPGVTLSQWRRQFPDGRVPLEVAIQIVWQVAQALDYAHEQHIIHRDVKPSNVMVETKPDGEIVARILDFGLAAEIRSSMGRVSREVRDTSGTRPYMAPEQWAGRKQGPATDQYALAAMFYELLVGEVPFASVFDTGDPIVMMTAVCNREVEFPEDCPRQAALRRALSKEPEQRFATCMEFLEAAAKSEQPTSQADQRVEHVGAFKLHLSRLQIACAAAAFLLIGCVMWYSGIGRKEAVRRQADPQWQEEVRNAERHAQEALRVVKADVARLTQEEDVHREAEEDRMAKEAAEAKRRATEEANRKANEDTKRQIAEPRVNYKYSYSVDKNGNACLSGKPCVTPKPEGELVVPDTVDGHKVVATNWDAFRDCDKLTKIVLPATLEYMGGSPFSGARSLSSIEVAKENPHFVSIDGVLYTKDMKELQDYPRARGVIKLLPSVVMVRNDAFATGKFTTAKVPEGITAVYDYAFFGCLNLEEVEFPESLNCVGFALFQDSPKLKKVVFHGDAPRCLRNPISGAARDVVIYVEKGSKGWKSPGSTDLPERWPTSGESRPIRYIDSLDGRERSDDQPVTSTQNGKAPAGKNGLMHRWSFNGDLKDSVGNRDAKMIDGNVAFEKGQVRIRPGGGYIDLGADVIPGGGEDEYTLEIWATKYSIQNWARVFHIPDNWGENDYYWSWNYGTDPRKWGWKIAGYGYWNRYQGDGTGIGVENHFVVVYGHDEEKKPCFHLCLLRHGNVYWHRGDRLGGSMFKSHSAFWLGHSFPSDKIAATADASYNEVRIWNRAFTHDEILRSSKLGPDRLIDDKDTVEGESVRASNAVELEEALTRAQSILDNLRPNVIWTDVIKSLREIERGCSSSKERIHLYVVQAEYMRKTYEYILSHSKGVKVPSVGNGVVQMYDCARNVLCVTEQKGKATITREVNVSDVLRNQALFETLYNAVILGKVAYKNLPQDEHAHLLVGAALIVKYFPCGSGSREAHIDSIIAAAEKRYATIRDFIDKVFIKYKYNYTIDDRGYIHLWGKGENEPCISPKPEGVFALPTEIDGHKVVQLGWHAFAGCDKMTTFIFPKDVVQGFWIDPYIFRNCPKLHRVIFQGDAPGLHVPPNTNSKGRNIFSFSAPDIVVEVKKGSKGWKDKNSTELPPRWPTMGYDSRPIRHITK